MANVVKSGAVIFAKDVGAVARFYEGVVPMTILAEEDGAVRLENESLQLVIHALPKLTLARYLCQFAHIARLYLFCGFVKIELE